MRHNKPQFLQAFCLLKCPKKTQFSLHILHPTAPGVVQCEILTTEASVEITFHCRNYQHLGYNYIQYICFRSLELKLESLKTGMDEKRVDCHVDDGSVGPELHVSLEKLDRVVPSAKEMSKDGLSAGSFTHESQTNWSHECKVPAMSCEDVETKPEVSGSTEQEKVLNVDKSTHTIYEGQGGCLKKRRGKRKRKDCGKNTNEASVRESDLSADVCKESSTSNCDEIEKSSGKDEAKANFKKDEIKDLMELLDSFLSVQGASAFCRRHDSQVCVT